MQSPPNQTVATKRVVANADGGAEGRGGGREGCECSPHRGGKSETARAHEINDGYHKQKRLPTVEILKKSPILLSVSFSSGDSPPSQRPQVTMKRRGKCHGGV